MEKIGRAEFERRTGKLHFSQQDNQSIMIAYRLSKYGHRGQERSGGERYFEHPKRVALILIDELKIYIPSMIISALLHDVREDSFILTQEDIELIFGEPVAKTVEILTKNNALAKPKRDEQYKKQLGFYDLLGQKDLEDYKEKALIIKLCDRLDNIRDMRGWSDEKRKEYIKETIEVYLPIAEKLNGYLFEEIKKICDAYQKK